MGLWVKANVPEGATFMTIGPSMANIVQFYGHRKAYGLSISPNPLRRNPSYDPLDNPVFTTSPTVTRRDCIRAIASGATVSGSNITRHTGASSRWLTVSSASTR